MKTSLYLSMSWAVLALGSMTGCQGNETNDMGVDIEFSSLRVEELGPNRAVVRFDTDVPSSCELQYGLAMATLDMTATDPNMSPGELALVHEVALEDLTPDTTYYFRAKAMDGDLRTFYSDIIEFKTPSGDDPTAFMTNVALVAEGTTVVDVSSNWGGGNNDSSFGIHNALDGNQATEWSSNGDGDNAYVVLDFGQDRTITHFAYRSRMMTDGSSIVKRVQVIVDGGEAVLGPFDTPDHTLRYVFELAEPVTARQVRVEAVDTTGGNTGAKEIQFFQP